MPKYFHTKSFYIFVGLFELILGLYYLLFDGACPIPSCPDIQSITLAKLLILAGIASLSVTSFHKRYSLHFLLSFFASLPLIILSLPFFANHLLIEAIPLSIMALGLLIAPFLPKNVFSEAESYLLTLAISLILILSSPLFSFLLPIMLISGLLLLIYSFRQEKSPLFPIFAAIAFQGFLAKGLDSKSPQLILLSLLAFIALIVFQVLKKNYSIKNSLKNLPAYKKINWDIESIGWVSVFVMLLTIIQSPTIPQDYHLPYLLVGITSIIMVGYFNFLPQSFYTEKSLLLAVVVYNLLLLLMAVITGGFNSPLNYLLVLPLLLIAVYLPRKFLFLSLALDVEFFLSFLLLSDSANKLISYFFLQSSLYTLIALIIYKTLEVKDIFIKKGTKC